MLTNLTFAGLIPSPRAPKGSPGVLYAASRKGQAEKGHRQARKQRNKRRRAAGQRRAARGKTKAKAKQGHRQTRARNTKAKENNMSSLRRGLHACTTGTPGGRHRHRQGAGTQDAPNCLQEGPKASQQKDLLSAPKCARGLTLLSFYEHGTPAHQ